MEQSSPDNYDIWLLVPEIFLFSWAIALILFDLVTKRKMLRVLSLLAMAGPLMTVALASYLAFTCRYGFGIGYGAMAINDPSSLFFKLFFLTAAFLVCALTLEDTRDRTAGCRGEFYALILIATVGMMILSASYEMLSLYLGLELATIPVIVLAAYNTSEKGSLSAGIKYLLIAAISSAFIIYGMSFMYGLGGTTELRQLSFNLARIHLENRDIGVILIGCNLLLLVGLSLRLAVPPFHLWVKTVYTRSPAPVAAFIATGLTMAVLLAFIKLFAVGLFQFYDPLLSPNDWGQPLGLVAVMGMIFGNVIAVRQKSLLAFAACSSISHAGYMLIGVLSFNELGLASVGFYAVSFLAVTIGLFAVALRLGNHNELATIDTFRNLWNRSRLNALALTALLLSLVGIPPLGGFFAKYYIFEAAIKMSAADAIYGWLYWLFIVGLLSSAFPIYYSARLIRAIFSASPPPALISATAVRVSIVALVMLAVLLFLGLYPSALHNLSLHISAAFGFGN